MGATVIKPEHLKPISPGAAQLRKLQALTHAYQPAEYHLLGRAIMHLLTAGIEFAVVSEDAARPRDLTLYRG